MNPIIPPPNNIGHAHVTTAFNTVSIAVIIPVIFSPPYSLGRGFCFLVNPKK